ncbi:MAG: alternative ribosome rescue aminoacyl-tRNA hydrolase ArfB [Chromatiales bacterium]|jgi:ribosome-associated protein
MPDSTDTGLQISDRLWLPYDEFQFIAIRAQGPGGQHVNKVSSAVQLRFDIRASSLPDGYKERLLKLKDRRLAKNGCLLIRAERFRSQERNKADALERLRQIILDANRDLRPRKATRPTRASRLRRLESKTRRGKLKTLRSKVDPI